MWYANGGNVSRRTLTLTDDLYEYLVSNSVREPDVLAKLRAETARLENAGMQIGPEQGQFMALLVELIGARRALEIGVFTGYSSTVVALALPEDGRLIACDVSDEYTTIARRYWEEAGVTRKIELKLRPATETLADLLASGASGTFDFAFIDADKEHLDHYYEQALALLRAGGLLLVDNVLWGGEVVDSASEDPIVRGIRALNAKAHRDPRVAVSLVPVGDGLLLARKR